jgi:hypothetical protein
LLDRADLTGSPTLQVLLFAEVSGNHAKAAAGKARYAHSQARCVRLDHALADRFGRPTRRRTLAMLMVAAPTGAAAVKSCRLARCDSAMTPDASLATVTC